MSEQAEQDLAWCRGQALGDEQVPSRVFPLLTLGVPPLVVLLTFEQAPALIGSELVSGSGTFLAAWPAGAEVPGLFARDLAARLQFLGAHTMALMVSAVAILVGLELVRLMVAAKLHRSWIGLLFRRSLFFPLLFVVAVAVLLSGTDARVSDFVIRTFGDAFDASPIGQLYTRVIPELIGKLPYADTTQVIQLLRVETTLEVTAEVAGALCIIAAVAIISFRWQDGEALWFRPGELRRQMNWLMALFVIASALLVFANAAVRSAAGWPLALLQAAGSDDKSHLRDLDLLTGLSTSLSSFWGLLSSAVLVGAFAPAFVSLTRDIDQAARIHLGARLLGTAPAETRAGTLSLRTDPAGTAPGFPSAFAFDLAWRGAPAPVARDWRAIKATQTFAAVKKWREEAGLDLSLSQIGTALLAAAAPLLTSPAIDLSKAILH